MSRLGLFLLMVSLACIAVSAESDAGGYLIYEKNGSFYAQNTATGKNNFSGADAGKVINSAINSLGDSGGSIAIASGKYLIGTTINLSSNVALYGRKGAVLKQNHNGDVIVGTGVEGVVLKGFAIDGNRAQFTGDGVTLAGGCQNNQISDLYVHDCKGNGILFSGATTEKNMVVGNRIENCEGAGIALYSSATDALISENHIYRTRHHGIILSRGGSNCQIANNKIIEAGYLRQNENDFCHGIAVDAWGDDPPGKNNVITGNIIRDPYMAGIEVADIQDFCVISNNVVENSKTHYGIYFGGGLAASSNATIVGNIVKGSDGSGIRIGSPYGDEKVTVNVTIGNNFVSGSNSHGIEIDTAGHVNIADNICLNNNGNGIDIAGENAELIAYRINIMGNQCYDDRTEKLQQYGLYLKNANYVSAIGNMLNSNKDGDVYRNNVSNYLEDNNQ